MLLQLGKIFDSGRNRIEAAIDVIEDLERPASSGLPEKTLSLDLGSPEVDVFGTPLKLNASVNGSVGILTPDKKVEIFGEAIAPPANTAYATLAVDGSLGVSGQAKGNVGVLQVSGQADATARFAYKHHLPVTGLTKHALVDLVRTTQLPQRDKIELLQPGQSHSFEAELNVDFGLKLKYGRSIDVKQEIDVLAADLSEPIKVHADFSASAAFGFNLYERMRVEVARAATRHPGWGRVRFERAHKRQITFGAAFALVVDYDGEKAALMLLDKIFARIPDVEIGETFGEFLEAFASGDWSEIKDKISKRAADVITKFVDDAGWGAWLTDSPQARQLVEAATWIVNEYNGIDDKVHGLWDKLLSRIDAAGVEHFRELIHRIATLDTQQLDVSKVVSGELADLLDLIETLSGYDVEELLLSGSIGTAIEKAISAAQNIESTLTGTPEEVLTRLHAFFQRTGIASVVEWLQTNATSVDALKKAGDAWIGSIVERLVGKTLDQVTEADRTALQRFAQKAQALLQIKENFGDRLRAAAAKLKGQFGISLSLEFSRITESSAIIDLEVDPAHATARNAVNRFLPAGDFQQLLATIDQIRVEDGQEPPYEIREVVLTSRNVRTSSTSLLISFLGLDKTGQSRIQESTIRITSDAGGAVTRTGVHAGGSVLRFDNRAARSEGGAWNRYEGTSSLSSPTAPYQRVSDALRLTYVREDDRTTDDELRSFEAILVQTGFYGSGTVLVPPTVPNAQTRMSVEISIPGGMADLAVVNGSDPAAWNVDIRNAALRWMLDRAEENPQRGIDNAAILKNPRFVQLWTDFDDEFRAAGRNGEFGAQIITRDGLGRQPVPHFIPIVTFVQQRGTRYRGFGDYRPPQPNTIPANLDAASTRAARQFSTGGDEWRGTPLLNFWLVLARIARANPARLRNARGVATLTWRRNADEDWSPKQYLVLPENVGVGPVIRSLFPLTV